MFGYVTANEPELKVKDYHKYKAYYCGLCQSLKRQYGSAGQLTLAYDMTFVIILLTSLYESETKAESQARREKEASERTPNERFLFFLRLMVEINKFQTKREKHSNNFILERKV